MILKFYFQRDEVSFFFLLSHPTALPCIRRADNAFNVWAVHQVLQDAELLLCGCRHKVLPLLRQDRQVSNAPLDIPLTVGIRRRKFHQMPNTPADKIAVTLKITVTAVGCAKDFCIGHSDRWFFRYNKLIRQ